MATNGRSWVFLDLGDVGGPVVLSSPATDQYVEAIRSAGADDRSRGGARLLGHLYCRYFADLFGGEKTPAIRHECSEIDANRQTFALMANVGFFLGSMLAMPNRVALGLAPNTPRHYTFDLPPLEAGGRRAYIEDVYCSLNDAGEGIRLLEEAGKDDVGAGGGGDRFESVIDETLAAFQHNIAVYSEEPMYIDGARGCINVATGMLRSGESLFLPVSLKR